MAFLTEPEPARGVATDVLPGIRRIVARNPGVMTYHGTNTYLLAAEDGLTVLDPGPADPQHVEEVVRAAEGVPILRIVVTHAHSDHHGNVRALQQATGAPSWGYRHSAAPRDFRADNILEDGDEIAGLRAIFTPGHAPDHLSFEYHVPETGQILFSGDHVMGWSSSIVNPPEGDMRAYYKSLEALLPRPDGIYLPGHGPLAHEPKALVRELLAHRKMREAAILEKLQNGPLSVAEIAKQLYAKTTESLQTAAERNVLAHLLKLLEEGRVAQLGEAPVQDRASFRASLKTDDRETIMAAFQEMARKDAQREFEKL